MYMDLRENANGNVRFNPNRNITQVSRTAQIHYLSSLLLLI